jgi:hypothetical protein
MLAPEYAPPTAAEADDYRAIRAGDRVTGAWSHPFYTLDPVQLGLAPPPPGARWIRYVDGALLVDESGRVLDTRWDLPDAIAPAYPEGGVPSYGGRGDYRPTPADYAAPGYGDPAPGAPAMMVVETTTTTTSPQRRR